MGCDATLLHISDLHFVEDIQTEGQRLSWRARTLLAKSHSFSKLQAFNRALINLRLRQRGHDLTLVTGDVTTDGSEGAFRTAREFFDNSEIHRDGRLIAFGLGLTKGSRIVLPGNHDRYRGRWLPIQHRSSFFERILETPEEYPYVRGYRRLPGTDPDQWTLLFFVFDSTAGLRTGFSRLERIARGYLTPTECLWLQTTAHDLAQNKKVKNIDGLELSFRLDRCVRVAVLHHHPVLGSIRTKSGGDQLTSLLNDALFVEKCFAAGINLVLFGHQHVQYTARREPPPGLDPTPFGPPKPIYFVCCPSTLEHSEERNGFYLFDFEQDRLRTELYEWRADSLAFDPVQLPEVRL